VEIFDLDFVSCGFSGDGHSRLVFRMGNKQPRDSRFADDKHGAFEAVDKKDRSKLRSALEAIDFDFLHVSSRRLSLLAFALHRLNFKAAEGTLQCASLVLKLLVRCSDSGCCEQARPGVSLSGDQPGLR
jgi:hypothetical protein